MTEQSTKGKRLSLYILIALVAGVVTGFLLNRNYINDEADKITKAGTQIALVQTAISTMTDTNQVAYKSLAAEKSKWVAEKAKFTAQEDKKLEPFSLLGDIFLRLIKMIVAPLVLTTLVVGVAKQGSINAIGRIGGKTLLWFIGSSFVSLLLGMVLVNFFQPGAAMHLTASDSGSNVTQNALTLREFLYHVFPTSLIDAMAKNEILQVVVFALFFGVATAAIGETGKVVIKAMDAIAHVILKMTGYIMNFAPFAVFGAMIAVIARQGIGILETYSKFIAEFYLGLLLFFGILLFACFLFIKKRVFTLLRHVKEPAILAFSTNSSEAAFPKTMLELERFGCDEKIVSFVLPLGYSFNLAGSMMYMSFACVFLAQAYGVHLDLGMQLNMLLILMLTSKGVAGVPRAALVVIAGTLATFKIPEAGLALLIGIDPILDMGRTAMNVLSNSIATAVISKWENALKA